MSARRRALWYGGIAVAWCGVAAVAPAQTRLPPIRRIDWPSAASSERFGRIDDIRVFSNGSVLINDIRARRLILVDSTLARAQIVLDSLGGVRRAYGGKGAGIIPLGRDSTLFVDQATLSMLLVDCRGDVGNIQAVPRSTDVAFLGSTAFGHPRSDTQGRLVYRAMYLPPMPVPTMDGAFAIPSPPDSAPLLRLVSGMPPETLAVLRIETPKMSTARDDAGKMIITAEVQPLPVVDDWAVLSDGTIAVVRGRDYRVEWIRPNGSRSQSRLGFEWRRLTDDEKMTVIDSVKRVAPQPVPGRRVETHFTTPPANELPDYRPPFKAPAARGDEDGNLWILTTVAGVNGGGYVYDVVRPDSGVVDRVQIPAGRLIVGFGPGGAVYMAMTDRAGSTLERSVYRP
jgi:hypothetical protein